VELNSDKVSKAFVTNFLTTLVYVLNKLLVEAFSAVYIKPFFLLTTLPKDVVIG